MADPVAATEVPAAAAADPAAGKPKPSFKCPKITDNPSGWGPCTMPEQFRDIPYQPFSKGDKIGKAADFTGTSYQGRNNRYVSQFGTGDAYSYFHAEDESTFQLVDSNRFPGRGGPGGFRARRWQNRTNRRDLHRARDDRRNAGMQQLSKGQKNRERDRQRQERKYQRKFAGRRRFNDRQQPLKTRLSSVEVQSSWQVKEELELNRLSKLHLDVKEPKDLVTCGVLEFYDKSYDRITTRNEKPLQSCDRVFHKVTTTDDPVLRQLSQTTTANVFATDAILATLMTCNRSVYSWDIVVQRIGKRLFFDKRDTADSEFDLLTVNETAPEPPQDESDSVNSPEHLSAEATYVNGAFSQQCLKRDAVHNLEQRNPFAESGEEVASVGYRYRLFKLSEDVSLVVRCEHDAVYKSKDSSNVEFMNIKTLNEWDPKGSGINWRQLLDTQRSAVLATELKNNACKLAKWTVSSLLAGSSLLRLGYVSRANPLDSRHHVILGTQSFKPQEFAAQITLNMNNCWGILKAIIDMLMKLDEGKYVILKDPNRPIVRIYAVPPNTFDNDDDESDGDADQAADDDEENEEEMIGIRVKSEASLFGMK